MWGREEKRQKQQRKETSMPVTILLSDLLWGNSELIAFPDIFWGAGVIMRKSLGREERMSALEFLIFKILGLGQLSPLQLSKGLYRTQYSSMFWIKPRKVLNSLSLKEENKFRILGQLSRNDNFHFLDTDKHLIKMSDFKKFVCLLNLLLGHTSQHMGS